MPRVPARKEERPAASAHERAVAEGRALRKQIPRSAHATWKAAPDRPDPVAVLLASGQNRLKHLLPLRHGRMSRSPFAYMRGAAAMMALDEAASPMSGIRVQACGDCHLGNFGAFASPERHVLFDITDFDETLPAPWEFDVKRLATSFVLLARNQGCDRVTTRNVTLTTLRAYRRRMHEFARMSPLDRWYALIDSQVLIREAPDKATRRRRQAFEKRARARTADKLLGRLMVEREGEVRFVENRPTLTRLKPGSALERSFLAAIARYPASLPEDRRYLLSRYRLEDIAFKVVGVGSVGTRCAVALFLSEAGDRLVLQVKEACPSVLAPFAGTRSFKHEGQRVVVGQRLMQCASDIFLGWASDDEGHAFYVRQLRDMKTSLALDTLQGQVMFNFADMCGWALARAHAKSGDAARLSGYIGTTEQLDEAMADYAIAYADQCEKDYKLFQRAIKNGKVAVEIEAAP